MIKISEWMTKSVITSQPQDSISDASKKMIKNDIGCLIVVNKNGKLIGILTERDILRSLVKKKMDIKNLKVKDAMSKKVKTTPKYSNILKVLKIMKTGKFRDLPIVHKGDVVGIITSKDLIRMLSN